MGRRILIAGNWKMNKPASEAVELARALKARADDLGDAEAAVCPPFTSLAAVRAELEGTPIAVGAQNVHWEDSGAFTGEVSAPMLAEIPVEFAIVGHSERRQYFGETDETVNQRTKAALSHGLRPIVCIGETLEQRNAGETEDVVRRQLEVALDGVTAEQLRTLVVAYEPVWAIGTGVTATPDQAQQVHAFLRKLLRDRMPEVADQLRILYGGSMKPANAADLLSQPDIDGGLIGGASLKAEDFFGIIACV